MSEHDALVRRDDEHLMGDEVFDEAPVRGITSADELPRDERGRVIGVWHVHLGSDVVFDMDRRLLDPCIGGALVERAIALGCSVLPGPFRPAIAEVEPPADTPVDTGIRLRRADLLAMSKVDLDRWAEETLGLKLDRRWAVERMVDRIFEDERVVEVIEP